MPGNDPPGTEPGDRGERQLRYQDGMLITPTGIPYEKLTSRILSLLMATVNMRKESSPQRVAFPYGGLSKQTGCQRGCYNHAVHCTAVSILNRPIPAITT